MDPLSRMLRFMGHSLGLPGNYSFAKRLGAGAQGEVWLAVDNDTNDLRAVKIVPRGPPAWRLSMVSREARTMARLGAGHVNIVGPKEVVLTGGYVMFVVEYVKGGSVSDFLKHAKMDEDLACYLFRQLLDAIAFCHANKVAYRDIKPANCLLTGPAWPPVLKLADFGLSETWDGKDDPVFQTLAGTPGYMSPEILGQFFAEDPSCTAKYDGTKADIYSAGVMLCVLILRSMPWEYDRYAARLPPREAMRRLWRLEGVEGVKWQEATSMSHRLSEPLRDLLDKMLEPDDTKRLSLADVKQHPWVTRELPAQLEAVLSTLRARQARHEEAGTGLPEAMLSERLKQIELLMKRAHSSRHGLGAIKYEMRVDLDTGTAFGSARGSAAGSAAGSITAGASVTVAALARRTRSGSDGAGAFDRISAPAVMTGNMGEGDGEELDGADGGGASGIAPPAAAAAAGGGGAAGSVHAS